MDSPFLPPHSHVTQLGQYEGLDKDRPFCGLFAGGPSGVTLSPSEGRQSEINLLTAAKKTTRLCLKSSLLLRRFVYLLLAKIDATDSVRAAARMKMFCFDKNTK